MLIISDNLWSEIKKIIPGRKSKVGRPQKDPRIILSGVFLCYNHWSSMAPIARLLWTANDCAWNI